MAVNLHRLWSLFFEAPPGPPQELINARRELRADIIQARIVARETRRAARDTLDRIGEVARLVHDGDSR